MAKHQKKTQSGVDLFGSPVELVKLIVKDKQQQEQLLESITAEGPLHKQVYSILLLKTMHLLVKELEKQSGKKFIPANGPTLISKKDEKEIFIPLVSPEIAKQDMETVADILSHSPVHEIAAFNTLLQAMNWCITTLKSK